MLTNESFEVYKYYLALKRHFTTPDYDFFKYNGKVKASHESFEKRRDKYCFVKLSKKKDWADYILANLIVDPNMWIGDLISDKGEQNYQNHMYKLQSLSYIFKTDIAKLNDDFNSNLLVVDGDYPTLFKQFQRKEVCLETLIIIDSFTQCFDYWAKKISDPVLFPDINSHIHKVKPFIKFSKKKMKEILEDRFYQSNA